MSNPTSSLHTVCGERGLPWALLGLGILVGDGALAHPGNEWIGEAYYDWQPFSHFNLTADYQLVVNPGYNRDRGPASVLGLRAHLAY